MPVKFVCASPEPIRFDKKLGRCVGWACFSKKAGVDYVDLHGDHFPDDELFAAVDALNHLPIEKREINIEHEGAARGVIVSAFALTEDFAKSANPPIDTQGCYGVLVSFKPDAALLASIESGGAFCLSIEGYAHNVETIAKSAGGAVAATAHKRTMRKIELTKLAVVEAGAHEGAAIAIVKRAPDAVAIWKAAAVVKRLPAFTSIDDNHQHKIYDVEEQDGWTSWDSALGGHEHAWIRNADGSIEIAVAAGHTHTLATTTDVEKTKMPTELEKTQAETITKNTARIASLTGLLIACAALPPEQVAYVSARKLDADGIEGFLAKSAAERATLATPLYKSTTTGETFFAGDNRIEMAKALDAQGVELAKAREDNKQGGFAKTAAKVACHYLGGVEAGTLIVKAVAGEKLTEAEQKIANDAIAAGNTTLGALTKTVGSGGGGAKGGSAAAVYEAALKAHATKINKSVVQATSDFNATEEGAALYEAAYGHSQVVVDDDND